MLIFVSAVLVVARQVVIYWTLKSHFSFGRFWVKLFSLHWFLTKVPVKVSQKSVTVLSGGYFDFGIGFGRGQLSRQLWKIQRSDLLVSFLNFLAKIKLLSKIKSVLIFAKKFKKRFLKSRPPSVNGVILIFECDDLVVASWVADFVKTYRFGRGQLSSDLFGLMDSLLFWPLQSKAPFQQVQERATTSVFILSWFKNQADKPLSYLKDLAGGLEALFSIELIPVHKKAQKKVAVPKVRK